VCHTDQIRLATILLHPPNATTRNFYVCLTPPKALHHVVGKDKYRKSTGTADLRKAKPIGARLIAEKLANSLDVNHPLPPFFGGAMPHTVPMHGD
jgi:hypothetical protein